MTMVGNLNLILNKSRPPQPGNPPPTIPPPPVVGLPNTPVPNPVSLTYAYRQIGRVWCHQWEDFSVQSNVAVRGHDGDTRRNTRRNRF